jgi:hypothetical protein
VADRRLTLLGLVLLSACNGGSALAEAPATPDPSAPKSAGAGTGHPAISLALAVDNTKLSVGEELRFRLTFQNTSNAAAVVVPPLDGSWHGKRMPAYELLFEDAKGQPVPHPLGFFEDGGCGLVNAIQPGDLQSVHARGALPLKNAHAWAPAFKVLPHARPGSVKLRVRYRAVSVPGATPLDLLSNAVELTIDGGSEALWACRSAQAERAKRHTYAENTPSRLVAHGEGYLLVFQRTQTNVEPSRTHTIGAIFAQRLGARGEALGDPVEIARSDTDWLGMVETLEVPDGLLVAFTTPRGREDRDVRLVLVDTSQGPLRPGPAKTIAAERGRPFFLGLARAGDRAGIVWRGMEGSKDVARFRSLGLRGDPAGSAVSIKASADFAGGELLLEPSGSDFLLVWQQGGPEVRLQRLAADGSPRGAAGSVKLADAMSLVALGPPGPLGPRADRIGIVAADSGVNHQRAGDSMGLHAIELAAADFKLISDAAASPWDERTARFGAAGWVEGKLARVWSEDRSLFFASAPGGAAPRVPLSTTAGGRFELNPTADNSRVLITWTDSRDDDQRRCAASADCVSESYVAVLDPSGKILVPPARATRTAVPRPIALHLTTWRDQCPAAASSAAAKTPK